MKGSMDDKIKKREEAEEKLKRSNFKEGEVIKPSTCETKIKESPIRSLILSVGTEWFTINNGNGRRICCV